MSRRNPDEMRTEQVSEREVRSEIAAIEHGAAGRVYTREEAERMEKLGSLADYFDKRRSYLAGLARDPRHVEGEAPSTPSTSRGGRRDTPLTPDLEQIRSRAMSAIDAHTYELSARAADTLEQLVEDDLDSPERGMTSAYIGAVGSTHYRSAFGKMLAEPTTAHLRFTTEEHEAVQRVNQVIERERSLGIGSQGGNYPVPFVLDPTIMLNSNGAINPIRKYARVVQVTGNTWNGVTSAGVVAGYHDELTEATDDSPTLTQPTANVEKAYAWVPFSIETGQDWTGLQIELAGLFQDAKDVLESSKFLTGLGHASHEPQGILVGATAIVTTATTAVLATADCYSLLEAVPARWQSRSVVLGHSTTLDQVYKLVGGGSVEPPILPTRDGAFLGRPKGEWSSVSSATTTSGSTVLITGDIDAGYRIFDRVGMSIELVPHVFGGSQRPIGARGLYAYWRNTAAVVVPQAIRALKIK